MRRSSALTLGPLVAVMYFTVSGGPFGLEGLVGSVGPGVALLLLVLTPLVFSVPGTLLIGELASMLPAEGGYYVWVKRAFGRFWGFWNGWLSWVYSLIDMAIYPVLFLQYIRFFAPGLRGLEGWLVALVLIWGATWLNLRGTRAVGQPRGGSSRRCSRRSRCSRWWRWGAGSSDPRRWQRRFGRSRTPGRRFSALSGSGSRRASGTTAGGTTPRRSAGRSSTPPRPNRH